MANFHEFETAVPDLARSARAILSSTTNAVLGTIRRDGSPRLSGIDPFFIDGGLCIGSMPGARKGQDLRRDARVALHSIPWDSRRVREGVEDPGEADVKITGTAVLATAPDVVNSMRAGLKTQRGYEPPDSSDLFTIDIESIAVISVADDQLVIDRWSTTDGRRTIRRS